ncbi:MAG TPA: HAD-IIIA family hydrolase [Phycisphaerae bacterium]|nr:HAD-IIIA family hydrolase [Phycisphaerae bacterium]
MADIRCLCLDVDGVLTDGRVFVDEDGRPLRAFHIHDGLAMHWFQRLVGPVVIVTGKASQGVAARARELDVHHLIQGSTDKLADLQQLLSRLDLRLEHVAAIGDDLLDLPVLKRCGFPIAVANAVDEVKAAARLVTQRPGGHGAVREAVEYLLREAGRWQDVTDNYAGSSSSRT